MFCVVGILSRGFSVCDFSHVALAILSKRQHNDVSACFELKEIVYL